eukprot:TRINITY_DN8712_c0_g1_i1.p1 TRINITY_DN8712_c0_g1~~TRINITY_DN8712_c0_g1_i1.p1  ORF type:complete len:259 (-),score=53.68 TRINITY_DN8712_c0_g1_i1:181-957(-)
MGKSVNIVKKTTPHTSIKDAVTRRLVGGPFLFHKYTAQGDKGDLLLSARRSDDVALTSVTTEADIIIRDGSHLLCAGGNLDMIGEWKSFTGLPSLRIKGDGVVAIRSPGRIVRVDLEPGESYHANSHFLLAYSSDIQYDGPVDSLDDPNKKTVLERKYDGKETVVVISHDVEEENKASPSVEGVDNDTDVQKRPWKSFIKLSVNPLAKKGASFYIQSSLPFSISSILPFGPSAHTDQAQPRGNRMLTLAPQPAESKAA